MDDTELTRLAIAEIMCELGETKQSSGISQERKINPLGRPNKRFLGRTLNSMMAHNKREDDRTMRSCRQKLRELRQRQLRGKRDDSPPARRTRSKNSSTSKKSEEKVTNRKWRKKERRSSRKKSCSSSSTSTAVSSRSRGRRKRTNSDEETSTSLSKKHKRERNRSRECHPPVTRDAERNAPNPQIIDGQRFPGNEFGQRQLEEYGENYYYALEQYMGTYTANAAALTAAAYNFHNFNYVNVLGANIRLEEEDASSVCSLVSFNSHTKSDDVNKPNGYVQTIDLSSNDSLDSQQNAGPLNANLHSISSSDSSIEFFVDLDTSSSSAPSSPAQAPVVLETDCISLDSDTDSIKSNISILTCSSATNIECNESDELPTPELGEVSEVLELSQVPEEPEVSEVSKVHEGAEVSEVAKVHEGAEVSEVPKVSGAALMADLSEVPVVCHAPGASAADGSSEFSKVLLDGSKTLVDLTDD